MAIVVWWLISAFVFFFILYSVIQSAIDRSKMAKNIQEIRDFLLTNKAAMKGQSELGPNELDIDLFEYCPGCEFKVMKNAASCPECGLLLRD